MTEKINPSEVNTEGDKTRKIRTEAWGTINPSVDWKLRQGTRVRRFLNFLERVSLILEKPVVWVVRKPVFNPLYHTGTITVLLLAIILFTGIYLTFFYQQFGFEASYKVVTRIDANLIGRVMRALHRYSSGAAVIFALLHGWRTFFQDRFRGPRWLAWVSGIVMAVFFWAVGVTGYWMIWDERVQAINQVLINLLSGTQEGVNFLVRFLVSPEAGTGWEFLLLLMVLHLGLSALVGLFFWLHIKRLSRAKWFPPQYFIWAIVGLCSVAAILVPVGMLPPANPEQLAVSLPVDLFFLAYLPAGLDLKPFVFWGAMLFLLTLLGVLPWLLLRRPLAIIKVDPQRCTGCTLCAEDCPYHALTMVERPKESKHKFIAQLEPKLCTSCGICIGSCPTLALTLGDLPPEFLWDETIKRASQYGNHPVKIIFTCERHAAQGARPFLQNECIRKTSEEQLGLSEVQVQVIPMTCIGMAHPDLAARVLKAGAAEVKFIGCPPEDCANREGNVWMQARLKRERQPKLDLAYQSAPINNAWLAPNDFVLAVNGLSSENIRSSFDEVSGYYYKITRANWKSFIPSIGLLAIVLAFQISLSGFPYQPFRGDQAAFQYSFVHQSGWPIQGLEEIVEAQKAPDQPTRVLFQVDGKPILDKTYPTQLAGLKKLSRAFEQIWLQPGAHHIRMIMYDRPNPAENQVLFDQVVNLNTRQVFAIHFEDSHTGGDAEAGRRLFLEDSFGANVGCRICHSLDPGVRLVGPSFASLGSLAAERVPGMSAEEYIRQSILEPNAYIVEGYPANQMVPNLGEILTKEQIDDLIAFLLTLK